jgi:hypothetical protein
VSYESPKVPPKRNLFDSLDLFDAPSRRKALRPTATMCGLALAERARI